MSNDIRILKDPDPTILWSDPGYDWNQAYKEEMETFITYVREGRVRHEYDMWHANGSLAVADCAFRSNQTGCRVLLPGFDPANQ